MLLNCGVEEDAWSPSDYKEIQSVHPKGDQYWIFIGRTDVEAETPILWPPDVKNWLTGKDPDAGKDWGQEEKGTTEDEMVGWHHWLSGHEFEQAPGDGDGQRSLACCNPWCCKEPDTTEWLNNNKMLLQCFKFHIKYISLLYYAYNCRVKWAYQTSKTNNHTSSKGHNQYQHQ